MASEWNIYDKRRDSAIPGIPAAKRDDHRHRWIRNIARFQPNRDRHSNSRVLNNSILHNRPDSNIVAILPKTEEKTSESAERILTVDQKSANSEISKMFFLLL